ncbi:hypothetical protein NL676_003686 [Syzygium grande]|nr:hypothetical protein NL676_003686 [Syzygium grande]
MWLTESVVIPDPSNKQWTQSGGRLFYWLVAAVGDNNKKPLVLWLNRGPGCSSIGYGAFQELGPFLVSPIGETLVSNMYSWNGAHEAYTFLKRWFKRLPGYKRRAFYIAGGSCAGYYIPSLAEIILKRNSGTTNAVMNLRGILYCLDWITTKNMNRKDVQQAVHAIPIAWTLWSKAIQQSYSLPAKEKSMLPTLELLIRSGLQIWIYRGDADSMIPFTATRIAISKLHLKRKAKWYSWGHSSKISGWSEIYEGITFVMTRGCSHEVPI